MIDRRGPISTLGLGLTAAFLPSPGVPFAACADPQFEMQPLVDTRAREAG